MVAMRLIIMLFSAVLSTAEAAVKDYFLEIAYFETDPDKTGSVWVTGVNGTLPGPEIRVRQYDRLRVTVTNNLPTEEVSIHWHGFEMKHAQEYDGSAHITQCGIKPNTTFVYDFVVDEHPGTYLYHDHAHSETHTVPGLYGALIVDPPEDHPEEPWTYDKEFSLLLTDWQNTHVHHFRPSTISRDMNAVGLVPFRNLLINGKGGYAVFNHVQEGGSSDGMVTRTTHVSELEQLLPAPGETWRLRISNGAQLFAIRFRIDGHLLRVIQADAADVQPYECDVISMSAGERFDVLVTFDRPVGSYWMRAETLESVGWHNGQLGVVRYGGAQKDALPADGFRQGHLVEESPNLKILNCVDDGPISDVCRPITDLRSKPRKGHSVDVGQDGKQQPHDYEVAARGFKSLTTPDKAHLVRVIDLEKSPNNFQDQFDGDYIQFSPPAVPFSHTNGSDYGLHPNTIQMHLDLGDTVRIILQQRDRTSHPWHMHGHKFAILGTGRPDYPKDCDLIFCRNEKWLGRDGLPELLDASVAPLKDTVHLPAGGWVVIQFKANNPGWWLFHCHMTHHLHDGMGLVMMEGKASEMPPRLTNASYYASRGFPSCGGDVEKFEKHGHHATSCNCWQDPTNFLDTHLRNTYTCSRNHLCGKHEYPENAPELQGRGFTSGMRDRQSGRPWRWALLGGETLIIICLRMLAKFANFRSKQDSQQIRGMIVEDLNEKQGQGGNKRRGQVSVLQLNGDLPQTCLSISWHVNQADSLADADFELPPASIMAILGTPAETEPWLEFFAGRASSGTAAISGIVTLGGVATADWNAAELRAARSYIGTLTPARPTCKLINALNLVLDLSHVPGFFGTKEKRSQHVAQIVKLFKLQDYLNTPLGKLSNEISRRFLLAQVCLLPCGLIIVKDPLDGLEEKAAHRMLLLFRIVASKLGTTVIFSCAAGNGVVGEVEAVTHVFSVSGQTRFAEVEELNSICQSSNHLVPAGESALTRFSSLLAKGLLDDCNEDAGPVMTQHSSIRSQVSGYGETQKNTVKRRSVRKSIISFASMDVLDDFHNTCDSHQCQSMDAEEFWADDLTVAKSKSLTKDAGWVSEDEGVGADVQLPIPERPVLLSSIPELGMKKILTIDEKEGDTQQRECSGVTVSIIELPDDEMPAASPAGFNITMLDDALQEDMHTGSMPVPSPPAQASDVDEQAIMHAQHSSASASIDGACQHVEPSFSSRISNTVSRRVSTMTSSISRRTLRGMRGVSVFSELGIERRRSSFMRQFVTLLKHRLLADIQEVLTIYKLLEVYGIGVMAGLIWYQKGSGETDIALGEQVSCLFFALSFWTGPSVFQALAASGPNYFILQAECVNGLYPVWIGVVSTAISNFFIYLVLVSVWQSACYALTDLGKDIPSVILAHLVIGLNVFYSRSLGLLLGALVPSALSNVVIGNIIAQTSIMTNGFFTELQPWMQWITVFSIPRYALRALMKLEFSWRDSIAVHPQLGFSSRGSTFSYLPLEVLKFFQIMKQRRMGVMQSPNDLDVAEDLVALFLFSFGLLIVYAIVVSRKIAALQS
eukprot:TRINITY_DN49875_c0_g1_i1.p1 TRINITY_DN49875_c0_g1~~TRINITY_DN49875_c0_g1_i1.p1  ORF type:complete len:1551 (-),score=267.18 TRINITY_DN49875_c0_g1_i1:164-4816(-)